MARCIKALILSAVAIALIITLIVGLWKPGYIWKLIDKDRIGRAEKGVSNKESGNSQDVSVLSEEWLSEYLLTDPGTNPAPIPVSGTNAFTHNPVEGLTISASENALDWERKFIVEKISDDKILGIARKYVNSNWLLLGGCDINGGMVSDEHMPGLINVEMDLSKLGIDERFWEFSQGVRIGDDGSVFLLPSNVSGSTLFCKTSQIGIIGVVIIGQGAETPVQHLIEHERDGLKNLYTNTSFFQTVFQGENASYNIYWPETLMTDELKQYPEKIAGIMGKYGINPNGSLNAAALQATKNFKSSNDMIGYLNDIKKALYSDPEYVGLARKLKDVDWSQKNYWPVEVVQAIKALDLAEKYLFGVRKFDTPGYNVDIVVLDKWPEDYEQETLGISMNLHTSKPFIFINARNKTKMPHLASEVGTEASSDLLLTITNELFHVVQSRAINFDSDESTTIWEAMAVSFEKEAFDYFSSVSGGKVIDPSQTTILTNRNYFEYLYSRTLVEPSLWNDNSDNKEYLRNHGYIASHWLDFLRDRYYKDNPNDFIAELLKRFSLSSSETGETFNLLLRRQTANSKAPSFGQPYSKDFIAFCQKNYTAMHSRLQYATPKIGDIKLDADNPMAELIIKWQPLSVAFQDFKIDSKGFDGKPVEYKLAVKGRLPWDRYFITRNFVDGSKTTTVDVDKEIFILPASTSGIITLAEIQAQTEEDLAHELSATYQVYLLRQPEEPTIEINKDYLVITPPDWSIPNPKDILSGYDIVITGPGGAEYRHREEVSLSEVKISIKDIKRKLKDKATGEDKDQYTAFIVERIDMPDGSSEYGPDGKMAKVMK